MVTLETVTLTASLPTITVYAQAATQAISFPPKLPASDLILFAKTTLRLLTNAVLATRVTLSIKEIASSVLSCPLLITILIALNSKDQPAFSVPMDTISIHPKFVANSTHFVS